MAKQQPNAAQKAKATLRKHVGELVEHTKTVAEYNGHGHLVGRQGKSGHVLPPTNSRPQSGARLPQSLCEGFGADDPPQTDYGTVDKG